MSDRVISAGSGPIDLWTGQWWRIPVSALHHADLAHVLVNCVLAWSVGAWLEQRWGSIRFALFLVPATFVPMLAELATGSVVIGFSGTVCAIFGAVIALQQIEPRPDDFSDESIQLALGLLLLGIPLAALGALDVANTAHVTGIVYGWFTAWVLCGPFPRTTLIRLCFAAAHLILVPVLWLTTHPIGSGRYLWYLAERSPHREKLLKVAVDTDPGLGGAWLRLADLRAADGQPLAAWTIVLRGLTFNPTDAGLIEEARRLWLRLKPGQERELAEAELDRVFGKQATPWSDAIRNRRAAPEPAAPVSLEIKLDPKLFPLDRPIELEWEPRAFGNEPGPRHEPERPDSAGEGTVL